MKIRTSSQSPSFNGALNNKYLLKSLEFISDHSTSFVAGTTLAMSTIARPIAISITPKVEKENKQYAISNSIASGLVKFALVESIALPIEKAMKNIDKTPEKYLKQKTINVLKGNSLSLQKSKYYNMLTQFLKLSVGFVTAIPKSMITVALIPILMNKLFKKKKENNKKFENLKNNNLSPIFNPITKDISFKGNLTSSIANIMNNQLVQKVVLSTNISEVNLARNMSIATDVLLTASSSLSTLKNKKIDKERKKPLILNSIISTAITLLAGCKIDKIAQKNTIKFIKKFEEANKRDPKLHKYIQGINIARPTIIFSGIYYILLPIISTFTAEKINTGIKERQQ